MDSTRVAQYFQVLFLTDKLLPKGRLYQMCRADYNAGSDQFAAVSPYTVESH